MHIDTHSIEYIYLHVTKCIQGNIDKIIFDNIFDTERDNEDKKNITISS